MWIKFCDGVGIFLILLVIFPDVVSSCAVISEVHPQEPEWVEIHNPCKMKMNLSEWLISDAATSDSVTCHVIPNCSLLTEESYFLIIGRKNSIQNVTNEAIAYFYADDSAIGSGLNNDGDEVTFYNSSYSSSMNYSGSSAGKSWSLCNGSWRESGTPTPGRENRCDEDIVEKEYVIIGFSVDSTVVNGVACGSLFRIEIENKADCSDYENVSVYYSIRSQAGDLISDGNFTKEVGCSAYEDTGHWLPNETGVFLLCGKVIKTAADEIGTNDSSVCRNITVIDSDGILCDLGIGIEPEDLLVESGNATFYSISLKDANCSNMIHPVEVAYWIEDVFGNVLSGYPKNSSTEMSCSSNLGRRQWTPDDFYGSEAYFLKANITGHFCSDSNSSNDLAWKMLVVKGAGYLPEAGSRIRIKKIYLGSDLKAKFGENVLVDIELYKGDTDKYAVYIWAESMEGKVVSKKSELHVHTKYADHELAVPVSIKPNCNGAYHNGEYRMVAEGLGSTDSVGFVVGGISSETCATKYGEYWIFGGNAAKNENENKSETHGRAELVSFQDAVPAGGNITTRIRVENTLGCAENFTIYSYVFNGTNCVSLGFDGESWKGGWDANKKVLEILPNSSAYLTLENMIENDAAPGTYKFRVRLKYANETEDSTRDIIIRPRPQMNESPELAYEHSRGIENITTDGTDARKNGTKNTATGMTVSYGSGILSFVSDIIYRNIAVASWLASFFKF